MIDTYRQGNVWGVLGINLTFDFICGISLYIRDVPCIYTVRNIYHTDGIYAGYTEYNAQYIPKASSGW